MNIDVLREEITADEGVKYEIYLDHLSLPTLGIGHLIKPEDPEHGLEVGTKIDEERVNELFEQDINLCMDDCRKWIEEFDDLPEEAQHILCNMMFNMGYTRTSKFRKLRENVKEKNWSGASQEMKSSRWYNQVTNRAERLVQRMKAVGA